jgi:hypothetical protein
MRDLQDYIRPNRPKPVQLLGRDDQIKEILEYTSFKTIRKAMLATNWVWLNRNGQFRTPTVTEIKRESKRLLKIVWDDIDRYPEEPYTFIATGGLKAYCFRVGNIKLLELSFIVSGHEMGYYDVTPDI